MHECERLEKLADIGNARKFYEKKRQPTAVPRLEHAHVGTNVEIWSTMSRAYMV